jgi:hypothetical protein
LFTKLRAIVRASGDLACCFVGICFVIMGRCLQGICSFNAVIRGAAPQTPAEPLVKILKAVHDAPAKFGKFRTTSNASELVEVRF